MRTLFKHPPFPATKKITSDQQALDEQRVAWIDRMILMVPDFVRTHKINSQPIHFFFIYSAQTQTALYQADSCVCGICFTNGHGILDKLDENDWARFQELVIERLDYFNEIEETTHVEFHDRVIVVFPMHAIRDTCVAWMLKEDPLDHTSPEKDADNPLRQRLTKNPSSGKVSDGHCASC